MNKEIERVQNEIIELEGDLDFIEHEKRIFLKKMELSHMKSKCNHKYQIKNEGYSYDGYDRIDYYALCICEECGTITEFNKKNQVAKFPKHIMYENDWERGI